MIASVSAWVSGRQASEVTSPPVSLISAATAARPSAEPDTSSSLAPRAPSAMAAARPRAPEAPVITMTLPETLKRDSGSRSSSSPISLLPGRNAERLLRVDDRDDADRAAVTLREPPRERHERAPLAGDRVEFTADVLDAGDPGGQHDLVRGLPVGEVVADLATGLCPVLVEQVRHDRPRAVLGHPGAERMVERLDVDADQLHALVHQPLRGVGVQPGGVGEVLVVVAEQMVRAGVDHPDVARQDLRRGQLQVLRGDHAPLL